MGKHKEVFYNCLNDIIKNRWLRLHQLSNSQGEVLMFHHVTDEIIDTIDGCCHTVIQFINILTHYFDAGYEFVDIDTAIQYARSDVMKKYVVVTFDDVPDNVYTNAYPFLKEYRIPFTVFVTVDYINREGYITKEHLSVLAGDSLCTIGAHTMTHPMLRNVNNYKWEVEESKKRLESITGRPISCMAYPYGKKSSVSNKVVRSVADAGYKYAFGTIEAYLDNSSVKDIYYLPRIVPTAHVPTIIHNATPFMTAFKSVFYIFLHSIK